MNGAKVDQADFPAMHVSAVSISETFSVGTDNGTAVSNNYRTPNHYPYTGELDKVVLTLTN